LVFSKPYALACDVRPDSSLTSSAPRLWSVSTAAIGFQKNGKYQNVLFSTSSPTYLAARAWLLSYMVHRDSFVPLSSPFRWRRARSLFFGRYFSHTPHFHRQFLRLLFGFNSFMGPF
jgi:hypothetical protein